MHNCKISQKCPSLSYGHKGNSGINIYIVNIQSQLRWILALMALEKATFFNTMHDRKIPGIQQGSTRKDQQLLLWHLQKWYPRVTVVLQQSRFCMGSGRNVRRGMENLTFITDCSKKGGYCTMPSRCKSRSVNASQLETHLSHNPTLKHPLLLNLTKVFRSQFCSWPLGQTSNLDLATPEVSIWIQTLEALPIWKVYLSLQPVAHKKFLEQSRALTTPKTQRSFLANGNGKVQKF